MWEDVYDNFSGLPKIHQIKLFNRLKEDFISNVVEDMKNAFTSIRETRFKEGLGCLHCGSVKVNRNGKYRGPKKS